MNARSNKGLRGVENDYIDKTPEYDLNSHTLNKSLLQNSEIKGVVGQTLFKEDAYLIGRAFGTIIRAYGGNKVVIGYDGRTSSPMLEEAVITALINSGITVYCIGCCSTPTLFFSVHHHKTHGGIMITGSHLQAEFNGFKMMLGHSPFQNQDIKQLGRIASNHLFTNGSGEAIRINTEKIYLDKIKQQLTTKAELSIAWDPGNGASSGVVRNFTAGIRGHHVIINGHVDGSFPAHPPDPSTSENLSQLQEIVLDQKCDFGIAFDGDGDRLGIVDNEGSILSNSQLMVLYSLDLLNRKPNSRIIVDIKSSQILFDIISQNNSEAIICKTGHSSIREKMQKSGALLAGEISGHFFFAENYYGYKDALFAAARLIDIIGNSGKTLSQLRNEMPLIFSTPEHFIHCPTSKKHSTIESLKKYLSEHNSNFIDVDGVRVTTEHGWWIAQASNTQDCLHARCESYSKTGLKKVVNELNTALSNSSDILLSELLNYD